MERTKKLVKNNYKIHTDSIKENIVPLLTDSQKKFVYADEANVINVALFGMTAKEWREQNTNLEGNIRDYTDILHLVILSNLEVLNASMIDNNISQRERLEKLNLPAQKQLMKLSSDKNLKEIASLETKSIQNPKLISSLEESEKIINGKVKSKKYDNFA